jgi:hypothetical protein
VEKNNQHLILIFYLAYIMLHKGVVVVVIRSVSIMGGSVGTWTGRIGLEQYLTIQHMKSTSRTIMDMPPQNNKTERAWSSMEM